MIRPNIHSFQQEPEHVLTIEKTKRKGDNIGKTSWGIKSTQSSQESIHATKHSQRLRNHPDPDPEGPKLDQEISNHYQKRRTTKIERTTIKWNLQGTGTSSFDKSEPIDTESALRLEIEPSSVAAAALSRAPSAAGREKVRRKMAVETNRNL